MKCPTCCTDAATCQVYRLNNICPTCLHKINISCQQNCMGYQPNYYELQNAFNQCCGCSTSFIIPPKVEKKKEDTLDKSVIALYMVAKLAMDEGLSISEFAAKYGYEFNVNDAHELMEAWLNQFKENK